MSSLPSTLEEVQYEVLQGDLTQNPKLQPSAIPSRDKELKTTAKKIIPAINELVKLIAICKQSVAVYSGQIEEKVNTYGEALSQTLKKEQLEALDSKLVEMDSTIQQAVKDVSEALKADYATAMDERLKHIEESLSASYTEALDKRLEALEANLNQPSGGSEGMKRRFHSSVKLARNATCQVPFNIKDMQDLDKQIEISCKTERTNEHIYAPEKYVLKDTSSSVYNVTSRPLELVVDPETGDITARNMGYLELVVYFYEMV